MKVQKVHTQSGGAETEAEKLKNTILLSDNSFSEKNNIYYVSVNGKPENDGKSEEYPLPTVAAVLKLNLEPSDSVLFKRGDIFRTDSSLTLKSGVFYGAYGTGVKPAIYGSLKNYSDEILWERSDHKNIWKVSLSTAEAGGITFNNDNYIGVWKRKLSELNSDGDFYHDVKNGILYLYFENINPGVFFDDIEISTTMDLMSAHNEKQQTENIRIDNLCFKYASFGPFIFSNVKNIKITNCIMGWHGGKVFSQSENKIIRYGNAIEFWYRCENVIVENCWIYQIFDAAITFQGFGNGNPEFTDIHFLNNLIEYCSMNIEFWAGQEDDNFEPRIENISFENNIIRFAGYGWGGIQRTDKEDQAILLGWNRLYRNLHNFTISDNILDCSDCYMIYMKPSSEQSGLYVENNSFYQKAYTGSHLFLETVKGYDIIADNQEKLEKAVTIFDRKPKLIKWLD